MYDKKVVAMMFDVIESRRYNKRYDVQQVLMESVGYLNYLYSDLIKKEVVASAGDEFQGLFYDLQSAFLYVRKLQLLVYPIKLRCGIGEGLIKYDNQSWLSTAFDGEAYYLCRDAINAIPKRKSSTICFNTASQSDKYLNMFCMSAVELKTRQSQVARLIEMIADIILPIRKTKKDESIKFYSFLLNERMRLIESESWNKIMGSYREINPLNIDLNCLFEMASTIEPPEIFGNPLFMEDYWEHGMSTQIARIMDTTRQNVDRYVSLGKIKESRTMDKALYDFLGEKKKK